MLGRILVFLGGLIVVALFGALLAPLFVDWTDFRKDFESQASRILGKKVTVQGAVNARLLPFPSVTLHDVTVGTDKDGQPLVRVARFSMDVELAPFLSGEARIFDMRLEEPRARIRLLKDGTLDWLRGSSAEIPARTVVLEKVSVIGGEIEFIDEQTGRERKITGLDADMSARSLAGPWAVDGRAVLDGEAGRFGLNSLQPEDGRKGIPLRLRLLPEKRPFEVELDGTLALKDGRPSYDGHFSALWKSPKPAKGEAVKTPPPRAKGEFQLTNERIGVKSYRFELGEVADPYVVTGEAKLDTGANPEFLLTAEGQQVDVNRLANNTQQGKTGRNAAGSVRQRLDLLIAMAAEIPIPNVPGLATLRLPAVVAGDTVLRDITLDVRPDGGAWKVDRAVVVLPGRTQVEAKGRLVLTEAPSFSGDLLIASTQPSGLSTWISGGVDPAIRQLKSMGFSASVNLTRQIQRFEKLEMAIGPAQLNGRLERQQIDEKSAALSIDLSGNEIDLDAARAIAGLVAGEDTAQAMLAQRIATRLKVERLTGYGMEARGVETIFTFDEGGFVVDRLNVANIAGTALKASGTVKGALPALSGKAQVALSATDPGPFLAMLAERLPKHPLIARFVNSASWYGDSNLTTSLVFGEAAGGGMAAKVAGTANGSRVSLDYGISNLAKRDDAKMTLSATLENPDSQILLGQAGLDPLPIGSGEPGRIQLSVNAAGAAPADTVVNFAAGQTSFSARGKIDLAAATFPKGSGAIKLESADLEPYLVMTGIVLPQGGTGLPAKLSGDLTVGDGKADLSGIDAEAAGNHMAGALSLTWTGAVPKFGGQLSMDHAELAWLAENVLGPVSDPATGSLSASPLPKRGSDFDLDVALTVRSFSPGALGSIADFTTRLNGAGGQLTFEDMAGKWLGGQMSGRLMLANTDGSGFYQSRLALRQADLATAAKQLGDTARLPALSGAFDADLVAEASGSSVAELLKGTNGSGTIKIGALAVNQFDTGLLPRLIAKADDIKGEITGARVEELVETLLAEAPSTFTNVELPFNITDGLLRATNASAANDTAKLDGALRVDLGKRATDGEIRIGFKAGDEALAGADPAMRILLSGDVGAPERRLDVGDLTNFLSLRAFERERRRVETLQSNVLEKQRLRREAALYRFNAEQRAIAAAQERAARAEEERLRAEALRRAAQEEARRKAEAEAAARARAAEDAGQLAPETPEERATTTDSIPPTPLLPVSPSEGVTRGEALPPLTFEGVPGVN